MRRLLLSLPVLLLTISSPAQSYNDIKAQIIAGKFDDAKKDLDKAMADGQFNSKPEAYILKSLIYAVVAEDPKPSSQGDQLRNEAYAAFNKFRDLQPNMDLLQDVVLKNAPSYLHATYFSAGYKNYQEQNWSAGLANFEKVISMSDLLIARNLFGASLDTNALILGGLVAINAGRPDIAAHYYGRLVEARVQGNSLEEIYRFMVRYHFSKGDLSDFEKARSLGQQMFPQSDFFRFDKVDFALSMEDRLDGKLKALESLLKADPANYKANFELGQLIHDTLFSISPGAVKPVNARELETIMMNAFTRASEIDPAAILPNLYLGEYYLNQVDALKERKATGKEVDNAYEAARIHYEKVTAIYAKQEKLSSVDRQWYKNVAGYLSDIYAYKKAAAKDNPALVDDYAGQEKKWNDLYNSIR